MISYIYIRSRKLSFGLPTIYCFFFEVEMRIMMLILLITKENKWNLFILSELKSKRQSLWTPSVHRPSLGLSVNFLQFILLLQTTESILPNSQFGANIVPNSDNLLIHTCLNVGTLCFSPSGGNKNSPISKEK